MNIYMPQDIVEKWAHKQRGSSIMKSRVFLRTSVLDTVNCLQYISRKNMVICWEIKMIIGLNHKNTNINKTKEKNVQNEHYEVWNAMWK